MDCFTKKSGSHSGAEDRCTYADTVIEPALDHVSASSHCVPYCQEDRVDEEGDQSKYRQSYGELLGLIGVANKFRQSAKQFFHRTRSYEDRERTDRCSDSRLAQSHSRCGKP